MLLPYSDLDWYTFHFTLEFLEPAFFDEFIGAVLRSALGYALHQIADLPVYRYLFETPQSRDLPERRYSGVPRPFVLCVPDQGQTWFATGEFLHFHLTLIGRGISHFRYFLEAFQYMGERGIGLNYSKFALVSVENVGLDGQRCTIYSEGEPSSHDVHLSGFSLDQFRNSKAQPTQMLLTFLTPVRLRSMKRLVKPEDFALHVYLRRLAERVRALGYFHNNMPWFDIDGSLIEHARSIQLEKRLQWQDWQFFLHGRPEKVGGLIGQAILRGHLTPFCSAFEVAQWLHVGKNTSYGFGAVAVQY